LRLCPRHRAVVEATHPQDGQREREVQPKLRTFGERADHPLVAEAGGLMLVGELSGRIVAMGGIRRLDATTCEILRMRVYLQYQRRGYGRAILDHLERAARSLGYPHATLITGEKRARERGTRPPPSVPGVQGLSPPGEMPPARLLLDAASSPRVQILPGHVLAAQGFPVADRDDTPMTHRHAPVGSPPQPHRHRRPAHHPAVLVPHQDQQPRRPRGTTIFALRFSVTRQPASSWLGGVRPVPGLRAGACGRGSCARPAACGADLCPQPVSALRRG
jgi:GNAT superfamily N-acetyltransferase